MFNRIPVPFYCLASILILGLNLFLQPTSAELPEPFLLKFGPKHGDTFRYRLFRPTEENVFQFSRTVRFGNKVMQNATLCFSGFIIFDWVSDGQRLTSNGDLRTDNTCNTFIDPENFNIGTISSTMIAPFAVPDITWKVKRFFLDYMCIYGMFDQVKDTEDEVLFSHYASNFHQYFTCEQYLEYEQQQSDVLGNETFDRIYDAYFENYAFDEEKRQFIDEWRSQTFTKKDFKISTDDKITKILLGEDTSKYPNLANHIFARNTNSPSDLDILTSLINKGFTDFTASWAFVATWYKQVYQYLDRSNSYQVIVTCGSIGQDACFVIFDYYQLEVQTSVDSIKAVFAWAFLNSGIGDFYELPLSGTAEARNLWAYSNFDIPGIWVFQLNQTGKGEESIKALKEHDVEITSRNDLCRQISPLMAPVESNAKFEILDCVLPDHKKVGVRYSQNGDRTDLEATYNNATNVINFTLHWKTIEETTIYISLDGVVYPEKYSVTFHSEDKEFSPINCKVAKLDDSIFKISWSGQLDKPRKLQALIDRGDSWNGVLDIVVDDWSKPLLFNVSLLGSYSVVVFKLSTQNGEATTYPVIKPEGMNCSTWIEKETNKNRRISNCKEQLGLWYGCPKVLEDAAEGATDAWYAHEEIRRGFNGWDYDLCCNYNNTELRNDLSDLGYCGNNNFISCYFNYGAHFCIRSPRYTCRDDENSDVIHHVSNQCCYDDDGALIKDENSFAIGSMDFEVNSIYNMAPHYYSELSPFSECCLDENCQAYKRFRPFVEGFFRSRLILPAFGDPHFYTADGIMFPFMGLGVYTMVATSEDPNFMMQVSTRKIGNGTVFSGFAISYNKTVTECFLFDTGTLFLSINKMTIELESVREVSKANVELSKKSQDEFSLFFTDTMFKLDVVVTNNFLNLFIGLPYTFESKTKGLIGFFDGDPSNDFLSSDGVTFDPDTDYESLHYGFGESWAVTESDWLFTNLDIKWTIKLHLDSHSDFKPTYRVTDVSDEFQTAAQVACNDDSSCVLDVLLTGDIQFANSHKAIASKLKDALASSQQYRLAATIEKSSNSQDNRVVLWVVLLTIGIILILIVGFSEAQRGHRIKLYSFCRYASK